MRRLKHPDPYSKQLGYLSLLGLLLWGVEGVLYWLGFYTEHRVSLHLRIIALTAALLATIVLLNFALKARSERPTRKRAIGWILTTVIVLYALVRLSGIGL